MSTVEMPLTTEDLGMVTSRRRRVAPDDIQSVAAREAELEQKIAERDSLDERLRAARETREQLQADLDGQRRDAERKLVTAKLALENANTEYVEAALTFFPRMRALAEADASYQRAWADARAAGCSDLGIKEKPLRVRTELIPAGF